MINFDGFFLYCAGGPNIFYTFVVSFKAGKLKGLND